MVLVLTRGHLYQIECYEGFQNTESEKDIRRASKSLLQERIRLNHNKRGWLSKEIEERDAEEVLSNDTYDRITISITKEREAIASRERQVKKYDRLKLRKDKIEENEGSSVDKDRWVMNLSLLSKGIKFSLSKKIPKEEIIAKVESSMKRIDRPEADNIRTKVSLTLQQVQTPKYNISKAERRD